MNRKTTMAESLIDIAVSKGIRDMKECSDRGIRNLVDLGKRLSKGNAQQDFFSFAQRILENPQSAYYQLSKRVIDQADERFLKSFGMNLGYHVWTADAEKIRAFARKHGFALPWKFILICVFLRNADYPCRPSKESCIRENRSESNAVFFCRERGRTVD